jgi:hypothetical protein
LGAILFLAAGGLIGAGQPDLPALLDGYRALQPASRGTEIRERTIRVGHMELAFEQGVLFPLEGAGGDVLGLFFDGKGRYSYRSEDPADRQVIESNLTRLTKDFLLHHFTVSDSFDRLVLFFAAPLIEELWAAGVAPGTAAEPAPALTPGRRDAFERIWKRISMTYLEYDHLAAETRMNGGSRQYLYAEIEGARETIGYTFDRVREFDERLFLFRKIQGVDVRFQQPISQQPVDGGRAKHAGAFALKDAHVEISTDDNRTATIRSDLTFEAGEDGLRVARLLLMNNRDPRHYNWASPKNALHIIRLTDETGADLPFSHRYHELLVQLARPATRGQTARLRVETRGDVLSGLYRERHNNYFDLMGVAWYPRADSWYSHGHTCRLKVRTRKPFVPVACGTTMAFSEAGDFYELETQSVRPVTQAVLFAGKYVTREETFGARTIRAHAYAAALQDSLEKIPRVAHKFLTFFETALGPYPFGDLDIVEAPQYGSAGEDYFIAFGIAPAGLVVITSEAYNARRDYQTRAASHAINARLAHEIAHQWFGHEAMPASARDAWISESFAEYLSGLALGAAPADGQNISGFAEMFSDWKFQARACKGKGPIEAANMLSGDGAWEDRRCLLYSRGPLVLHMLRAMAGNDGFFAILRRFLEMADQGPVTTGDFRAAAEQVLKTDLGWFFEDWYHKGGIPEIRVEYEVKQAGPGAVVLAGRAEQMAGPGFRRVLIPLLLDYGGERREVRLVFQDQPIEEFNFALQERPKKVSVDPYQNNLVVYR